MRPVNTDQDKKPWKPATSNLALQDIRRSAIDALNKRDEQLSRGRLNKDNRFSPYREEKRGDGTGSRFVVDPVLSEIKHTGEETIALTKSRWAEFCSEPRDEKVYAERLVKQTRDDHLAEMKAAGKEVEASLAPISEAEMPVLPTPKPKKKEPVLIG